MRRTEEERGGSERERMTEREKVLMTISERVRGERARK